MEQKDWIRFILGIIAVLIFIMFAFLAANTMKIEAKSCKTLHANCVNASDKSCCDGLSCQMGMGGYKCRVVMPTIVIPTIVPPTMKPLPTIAPIPRIWCHTYFIDCCKDAEFLGTKCPIKWSEGKCPTIEPTKIPEPTVTPEITPEVTVVPTVEPTKTVVQTFTPAVTTPKCEEMTPTKVNDVWYSDYEVSNGKASLILHWGTNEEYKNVNIAYGLQPYEWLYGVPLTENSGSLKIGGLNPYTTYWFQVAYVRDSCGVGEYSTPVDP